MEENAEELPALHLEAAEHFAVLVEGVPARRWESPTPCREWDLHALVNHNVAENLWVPEIMRGATAAEIGDRFDGDVLGSDPARACRASTEPACTAIEAPGAMARTVHLSFGDLPGAEFTKQRIVDLVVHAWDVAAAAGLDWDAPGRLVDSCLAWGEAWKPMLLASPAYFDPPIEPATDAGPRTRLLNVFGRDPGKWT